jgi:hypothetical protein
MKKMNLLPVLLVLFAGVVLLGCAPEPDIKDYYGDLTISNSPTGYSYYAFVYGHNVLPSNYEEYNSMTNGPIAAGSGVSPVNLVWSGGTRSGNFLVTLTSGSTRKMVIASFNNKGDATVNWDSMSDVPSR